MAVRFKDLHGVTLKETYNPGDGREERVTTVKWAYESKYYHYEHLSYGDTIYMLDKDNNFEIVELIVKSASLRWDGRMNITACKASDAELMKNYIPYHYDSGNNKKYNKYLIKTYVRGNRTHTGLFFTTIKEAEQYQKQLRNNIGFIFLKPGDIVYLVVDSRRLIEAEVSNIVTTLEGSEEYFNLLLKDIGTIKFNQMRYEERVSDLLETFFYTYQLNIPNESGNGYTRYLKQDIKVYLKKEDAEKSIKDSEKRKSKSATVKYLKSIENHDGKPISHTDKKGKQLHYGDKVAYAVSGGSSAPRISFGIVKGESKEKVSIVDEEKDRNGNEEKHSVSPRCILLIKEAEFNATSGYSFVKPKAK